MSHEKRGQNDMPVIRSAPFSVRTVLIATTLVAVALGVIVLSS
jgi:hypothetical protein